LEESPHCIISLSPIYLLDATITLKTDFGMSNLFIGVMNGVILNTDPHFQIIEITHATPAQDIHSWYCVPI